MGDGHHAYPIGYDKRANSFPVVFGFENVKLIRFPIGKEVIDEVGVIGVRLCFVSVMEHIIAVSPFNVKLLRRTFRGNVPTRTSWSSRLRVNFHFSTKMSVDRHPVRGDRHPSAPCSDRIYRIHRIARSGNDKRLCSGLTGLAEKGSLCPSVFFVVNSLRPCVLR